MRLTSASECEVIVRDTKSFLAWAESAKSKEKELNKNNKTDVFFEIDFMSEDIRMPSRKPRGHEKVLIKEGKRYVEEIEYKNEAGKNIPHSVCMTSDVKDAKEFTFEEAAAIQNDFSMVFPSLRKTRLVSTKVQSKPFDAIIAFEDEEGAKRYADKSSAQKVCAALNEKRYSRSVKNGSFRVKFLIPC